MVLYVMTVLSLFVSNFFFAWCQEKAVFRVCGNFFVSPILCFFFSMYANAYGILSCCGCKFDFFFFFFFSISFLIIVSVIMLC